MNSILRTSALAMFVACAPPAWGQETVGDLQKRGIKPMSADQLKAFVPGTTYVVLRSGAGMSGDPLILELGAEGQANGTRGQNSMTGDWKIDDAGRLCYSASPTVSRGRRMPSEGCHFVFKADDAYYRASDKDDGAAPLLKVEFKH